MKLPDRPKNQMQERCHADLEDILCSKTTIKILKTLMRLGQLNVSDIAQQVDANYTVTHVRLRLLESEGILQQRISGRTRYYRFNESSPKTRALQHLIEVWEIPDHTVELSP